MTREEHLPANTGDNGETLRSGVLLKGQHLSWAYFCLTVLLDVLCVRVDVNRCLAIVIHHSSDRPARVHPDRAITVISVRGRHTTDDAYD